MTEHYTFADTAAGLKHAWDTAVSLRRGGFKTRLVTRRISMSMVHTVLATPTRLSRKERGLTL